MGQCDLRSVNLIDLFGIKGNCLRTGRSRSLCLLIRRMKKQTVVIMEAYYFCQLHTEFFSNNLLSRLTLYAGEITGDHQYGFRSNRSITDHTCCIRQIPEKKWEYSEAVHQLFLDFNKANVSVTRKVLFNILTEFGISMKEVRLIKSV